VRAERKLAWQWAAGVRRSRDFLRRHGNVAGATLGMLVARGLGLAWTLALSLDAGLAAYGLYAIAYSLSGVFTGILDGPPTIRAARVSSGDFYSDQRIRALIGTPLLVGGLLITRVSYIAGFAMIFSGGEMLLGYPKAAARRRGDPRLEQIIDLGRQASSIALGAGALFIGGFGISGITFAYALPFFFVGFPIAAKALRLPSTPLPVREWMTLSGTGLVAAGYVQLDVVIVGLRLNSAAAGVYGIASLTAWAFAVPAQQLATRKIPHLRLKTLSPHEMARSWHLGAVGGIALLGVGACVHLFQVGPNSLALSLVLMAPFVMTRGLNWAMNVAAAFVDSDVARLWASLAGLVVDVAVLLALAPSIGASSAAVASSVADAVLLTAYLRITHGRMSRAALVTYIALVLAAAALAVLM
jgi:hypothetical protein